MVLLSDETHAYTHKDLHCLNMLRHPVWVFDIDNVTMYWANAAAISTVWNAESLQELLQRDFKSDMSEGSKSWLLHFQQNELQKNTYATEKWTFYPNLTAQILDVTCSGIRIPTTTGTGSTIAMLVEAALSENQAKIADVTSRSVEILKHLPVAVSQFTLDGTKLIYQNPKATQLFGTADAKTSMDHSDIPEGPEEEKHDEAKQTNEDNGNQMSNENELLHRFVDIKAGQKALLSIQNDEIFSAETKLYMKESSSSTKNTTSVNGEPAESSRSNLLSKRKNRRKNSIIATENNNDSTTSLNFDVSDGSDDEVKQQRQPRRRQRQERWFNVLLRKARDPITSDFVILFIARDITDIVRARKDSVRAAMKSEFLDVMAHEIRTPLHQIVGYMDLLEADSKQLSNDQLNHINQVQSSCALLMAIINDLLDCSKLEYGQIQIETISFALPKLVDGCLAAIGPQIQSKGLQLKRVVDPSCTVLQNQHMISDPNRLRQILQNLLSNAVKFTETGSITLAVHSIPSETNEDDTNGHHGNEDHQDTRWFRFEVIDSGIGISPSEQKIVFERYRQANSSVARNYGGTGLGLPICKGLVELLGGRIGLQSQVGEGTTIYFELPFRVAPHAPCQVNGAVRRLSSFDLNPVESLSEQPTVMNILVVEDNKVNQKVVKAMLQRLGHRVTVAENGKVALDEINQQQFHVILMDVQMPIMDGIECTKYIRNVLQYSKERLPILGLTAGFQNSDRDYYVNEIGMNGCLGKPLPMEKLKQAISCYSNQVECFNSSDS